MTDNFGSIDTRLFWRNLAERSIKTFVQTLLVVVTGSAVISDVNWVAAASTAGLAALISACVALVGSSVPATGNFYADAAERAAKTFLSALISSLTVYTGFLDVPWTDTLSMALLAALASVVTSLGGQATVGSASLVRK